MRSRIKISIGTALPLLGCALVSQAVAQPMNLVQDGDFEVGANKTLPKSWQLTGGASDVVAGYGDGGNEGTVALKLNSLPGKLAKLSQVVDVTPGSELIFSADVRSSGRVVVMVGNVRMSYHRQGEWQKVSGLIRPGIAKTVSIVFEMTSLSAQPANVTVTNVSLEPFERPAVLVRRPSSGSTFLAQNGEAAATIVYPAEPAVYARLARQLQAAIAKKSGVTLPLLSDTEATESDAPNLKPELAAQNLIVLGRLGINRALWPAYNHFLAGSDGYYPGGNGYEVRTAANVLRNGKNHIILGGSNEAGAARAVEAFLKKVQALPASKGKLDLPWLLDTELGGDCLAAVKEQDAKWKADPLDVTLPKVEAGNGTIRRWYENAMGYYWTGWASYRERAEELLKPVLEDSTYPHHYVGENFVRTFDMLDNSPLFEKERAAVDKLIFSNFCDVQTQNGDITWMTTFSPPYDTIGVSNRHQIAPWMTDLAYADYLHNYFDLPDKIQALVDFRRSEKESFMRSMTKERWGASLPDLPVAEAEEETALAMMRFALERGEYDLFNSRRAREMPQIDPIDPRTGYWVRPAGGFDSHFMFGLLATYYRDGRYESLRETLPSSKPFMTRYLAGIHAYSPGSEVKASGTDEWTGVRVPKIMPHRLNNLGRLQGTKFATPTFPPTNLFESGAFRSGFKPEDDFVSLTGVAGGMIPGIFTSFVSNGTSWLRGNEDIFSSPSDRYFDQSAVSVLRTDQWQTQDRLYSAAAEKLWSANLYRSGAIAFQMDPFAGTKWQRSVIWIRPGLYVVRDRLSAKGAGQFQVSVSWFTLGPHDWKDGVRTNYSPTGQLRITPLGAGFGVPDPSAPVLRQTSTATLKAGESVTSATVLQAYKPGQEAEMTAHALGDNAVLLTAGKQSRQNLLVAWEPQAVRGVTSDAKTVIIGDGSLEILHGTTLEANGKVLIESPRPLSLRVEWKTGRLIVDNPNQAASIQVNGQEVPLASETIQLKPQTAPAELARVLDAAVPSPAATEKTLAKANELAVQDDSLKWKTAWNYEGLRLPMPVTGTKLVAGDIIDFGRVVNLARIRFGARTGGWSPRTLPESIWTAVPGAEGQMPGVDSPAWKKVEQTAQWGAGIRSGNYGEAVPVEQDSQFMDLSGVKARFVRAEGIGRFIFLDGDDLGFERPLQVRLTPENGLFVSPQFWPTYVGRIAPQDQVAMLSADGKEVFKYVSPTTLQVAELLPLENGKTGIGLAAIDGRIRLLRQDGSLQRDIDLYGLHQDFNREFGRPNTRQPVGGFILPFSLGVWRQKGKDPELVVGRYAHYSFVDLATGKLNGVLRAIGYTQPAMLPSGVDFDGDGNEEQVVLGRGTVWHLFGPEDRRVEEPDGIVFFPQIYHDKSLLEPAWDAGINGARPILLETIPAIDGQQPRFVLAARDNYIGFYDGKTRKWGATWSPQVSIRAASSIPIGDGKLRTLVATEDGLLWDAVYTDPLKPPAEFKVVTMPDNLARITSRPGLKDMALLAGEHGLYLYNGSSSLRMLAAGSFVDAQWADATGRSVLAVRKDGTVLKLELIAP